MSLPAPVSASSYSRHDVGLLRAARLMRALGPEASGIWAELSAEEVRCLSSVMDTVGDDPLAEAEAARRFSRDVRSAHLGGTVPVTSGLQAGDVWAALSSLSAETLAELLRGERPAVAALILSRLSSDAAARTLRMLPTALAVETMQRLLHLGTPHAGALKALEIYLEARLPLLSLQGTRSGHERVARIFDQLDTRAESVFLAALENAEPGAGRKVRALMFTFDDLSALDAGGMQTLLAAVDRASLIIALKGARPATSAAFFANMTQRAGELLREEMAALGPLRRSEIEAARHEIVTLARQLVQRGEIRTASARNSLEDEVVE